MTHTYEITTSTPLDPKAATRGDRFVVVRDDGKRQCSGRLDGGEVVVETGYIPDDDLDARLEKLAKASAAERLGRAAASVSGGKATSGARKRDK